MTSSRPNRRWLRVLQGRRRLVISLLAGIALLVALPDAMRLGHRLLLAWDLTALLYVASAFWIAVRSTVAQCRERGALYDQADWVILLTVAASAAASFGAIYWELAAVRSKADLPALALAITGATVVLGWAFTHVIFAMHYANVYYRPDHLGQPGGLRFPGGREPDYGDFMYYAFVIGCAAQTGDVATESSSMRRITLAHGVVAFAINTAILALTINIGASLLS